MTTPRLALVFAMLLALFLLGTLPLRLALAGTAITAHSASGSLWHGQLAAAAWRGFAIGDVDLGLSPLALLTGVRRVDFTTPTLSGRVALTGPDVGLEGLTGTAAPGHIAGVPVNTVRFTDFGADFGSGRCQTAGGSLSIDIGGALAGNGSFTGTPRCDGDRLLLPLQADNGRLELRVSGDGRYAATISIDNVEAAARPGLLATGFQPTPTGLALSVQGQL
jgi:general secretion pathway protein N